MKSTSFESKPDIDEHLDSRRQQLELARRLDLFGRNAESFLSEQFQNLQRSIEEFEREKSAWRRQVRRESNQLTRQRERLEQLQADLNERAQQNAIPTPTRRAASAAARASGASPVRLLLRPQSATSMQIGMLLAELSRLNREMGGEGVKFLLREIRKPIRRLFRRQSSDVPPGRILCVSAESVQPLKARGTHVTLGDELVDRLEGWIAFKARLLQSSLSSHELEEEFAAGRVVNDRSSQDLLKEARHHVDAAGFPGTAESSHGIDPYQPYDSARVCFERLEDCYELLRTHHNVQVHLDSPADAIF